MRNLVIPNWYDIYNFELIVNSKKDEEMKNCLLNLKVYIEDYYIEYVNKCVTNDLHNLMPHYNGRLDNIRENEKNCLLHCYKSTNDLSEMKKKIMENQDNETMGFCQYCGINSPNSFDHYAPKEKFPEYCILPKNLIPCCRECNGKKSSIWIQYGNRKIINFYYDKIPDEILLYSKILYEDDIPIALFELKYKDHINKYFFNLIQSHFQILNLYRRYTERSTSEISLIKEMIVYFYNDDKLTEDLVIKYLNNHASSMRKNRGKNYWKAALYNGLSSSDAFIQNILGVDNH